MTTDIIQLKGIPDLKRLMDIGPLRHPLVAVVDFSRTDNVVSEVVRVSCDFYAVMFKSQCSNVFKYGRKSLDFQDGSLVCVPPHQVLELDKSEMENAGRSGWGLFFHPDLLRGTSLGTKMKEYTFFSYDLAEALHLSEKEKTVLGDCTAKIESELQENIDRHSQTLIVSNIELLLNYCARYYERQFITRRVTHKGIVAKVNELLQDYFASEQAEVAGLPTVKYLAEKVCLSPGYLSDLLKRETGMNAQEHIHYALIETAKSSLLGSDETVSRIAHSLGFEYPQYFNKLFKKMTGKTPVEFRNLN
jgi:AraC-like DNA-binding protein